VYLAAEYLCLFIAIKRCRWHVLDYILEVYMITLPYRIEGPYYWRVSVPIQRTQEKYAPNAPDAVAKMQG